MVGKIYYAQVNLCRNETYRRVKAIEALVLEDLVPGGGDAYPAQVLLYHVHPSVCNFQNCCSVPTTLCPRSLDPQFSK